MLIIKQSKYRQNSAFTYNTWSIYRSRIKNGLQINFFDLQTILYLILITLSSSITFLAHCLLLLPSYYCILTILYYFSCLHSILFPQIKRLTFLHTAIHTNKHLELSCFTFKDLVFRIKAKHLFPDFKSHAFFFSLKQVNLLKSL